VSGRETCPPRVKLLALIADGESVPHLETCEDCAEFVAAAMEVLTAFDDRSDMERAIAAGIDAILEDTAPHRWISVLVNSPDMHHSVILRDLLRRSDEWYGRDPRAGLDLTTAAVAICDAMTARGSAPAQDLVFEVLKEHSILLRQMNKLNDAQKFLGRARAAAARTTEPELHQAIVSLCAAITYAEPDLARFDDAFELAESASTAFDRHGDRRRTLLAWHTKAYVLVVTNRFDAAVPLLRNVIAEILDAGGTRRDYARAHGLLALCLVNLGSYAEAIDHARMAEQTHSDCGDTVDAARAAHYTALALAGMGRFAEVSAEFGRTAEIVFTSGMLDVWCLMRLDFVASALADDEGADVRAHVESVARVCMTVAMRGPTQRQQYAAEALDYLRRLAARDVVTSDIVNHVRAFMVRNASHRPARFTPLPGTAFVM